VEFLTATKNQQAVSLILSIDQAISKTGQKNRARDYHGRALQNFGP